MGDASEIKTTRKTKPNRLLLYLFILIYLLIPILSTESILCWSIGIAGIHKTAKLYENKEENKEVKALKHLLISLALASIFNITVYYVSKILAKAIG
jgi:hypothetical protein